MSNNLQSAIKGICSQYGNNAGMMMDIVRTIQDQFWCVSDEAIDLIAKEVGIPRVEVERRFPFTRFSPRNRKEK